MVRLFRILNIKSRGKFTLLQRVHRNIPFQRMYHYLTKITKDGYYSVEDYIDFTTKMENNCFNEIYRRNKDVNISELISSHLKK